MFCSNCGNSINNESRFCDKCGTPVNANMSNEIVKQESPKKNNGALIVIIVIVAFFGLLVCGGIGLVILFSLNSSGLADHTIVCELKGKDNNKGTIKMVLVDENSRVKRIESTIASEFEDKKVAESYYKYLGKSACNSYNEEYEECNSKLIDKRVETTIVIDYEKKAKEECSDISNAKEKKKCKQDALDCYTQGCQKYTNTEAIKKAEEELKSSVYADYTIKCK